MFMAATGVLNALSNSYTMFTVFTFLNALGSSAIFPLVFTIGVEMVGKKKRELTSVVLNFFYALGEAGIGLVAWWLRGWNYIQLAVSAPAVIFILYFW